MTGLQCYSESTIKTQGSYSLKIEAATDSLGDTLTRTVSPVIDLSGETSITLDVRASRTGSNFKIGFHDSGGNTIEHTVNILAIDTWQTDYIDISAVDDADKDAIDSVILTVLNADVDNTIYLDNTFSLLLVELTETGVGSESIDTTHSIILPMSDSGNLSDSVAVIKHATNTGDGYNIWGYNKVPYNGHQVIIEEVNVIVITTPSSVVERADYIDVATQTFSALFSEYLGYPSPIDLKDLLPRKFVEGEENQRIIDYVDTCNEVYNEIYTKIDDFGLLSNLDGAPVAYVRYLSEFIGFEGLNFPRDNDEELRKQLKWAIDWYKEKGLYKSIDIVLYLQEMSGIVYDMWTKDYTSFDLVYPGITEYKESAGYYKSPHLSIDVNLNKHEGNSEHLMESDRLSDLTDLLEQDRPANTVFHISLVLEAMTYGDHVVYTITDSGVATIIADDWLFAPATPNEREYNLNPYNEVEFGGTSISGALDIDKWKLGIGHVGEQPSQYWDDLETEVLNGSITSADITDQGAYYLYAFEVASAIAQDNMTELALFDGATPMLFATFPYLDKIDGTTLKIKVKVYK